MSRKSNKRSNKTKKYRTRKLRQRKLRQRKQKTIVMIGCSKKHKKSCKNTKDLGNKDCPNCGPNCHCGPNCKCVNPCPGNCYLNRCQKGGSGCGSCGCPISPLSWNKMNQFGGNMGTYPEVLKEPVMPDIKGGNQGILGIGQNGGICSSCGPIPVMSNQSGGNFFKQIGAMPGTEVGKPWSPNNLPGVNGVGSDANYFKPYDLNNDPTRQQLTADANAGYLTKNSMIGGYRYDKKSSDSKRGGGLIPQDLVNLGRDFNYNFKTAYNALNGYKAPVDPAPYKGQLTGVLNKSII